MNALLPLAEAQARLLALATPLPAIQVASSDALRHYLAEPLLAARTQPSADLSAMDGYALREGETGPWQVIGESAAGHPFAGLVDPGEAVRISTGALMPDGADAVVLQENVTRDGETISLNGEGEPTARHIRRAGFDFRIGETLLPAGSAIGPAQLALAVSGGHPALPVRRLPHVAIIDSGDELSPDAAHCEPHQIPASNGMMIAGLARPLAGSVSLAGPIPDQLDMLVGALAAFEDADVIVTSGGASVGDHDLIRPALEAWGAEIDFWKVAMKPGKPLLVAKRGRQIVLGLPGNPVSSFVTAFFFLLPLLRALAGARQPLPLSELAHLDDDLPATGPRAEYLRAFIAGNRVETFGQQDSSALRTLALCNALVCRPENAPSAKIDDLVEVYRLQNGGIA